jgi:hypothetical protein
MSMKKLNRLLPIGLIMLSAGLGLHIWTRGDYSESAAGFLIGISLVFVIAGFVGRFAKQSNVLSK